jgi:hypothetical protein
LLAKQKTSLEALCKHLRSFKKFTPARGRWFKASLSYKNKNTAGVLVAHTCNPGTWEAEIMRIETPGQQIVPETPSPK